MNVTVQEAWNLLQKSRKIAITSHIHPDGDAVGSSLAMYHYLKSLGKEVAVVIEDRPPEWVFVLPGAKTIQTAEEYIGNPELLILLDARMGRAGSVTEKIKVPILNIDHHATNDGAADYLFLNADSSSTCEILYRMFCEMDIIITKEMAINLYAGVATDTGFFRFSNTTADSFQIAAELVRLGAEPGVIGDAAATKRFEEIRMIAEALNTAELFNDGKTVGVFADENLKDLELTDDVIDMIRFTKGVDIAFLIKYESENTYRVRMRSRFADVSKILKPLGGGGHVNSAGCTLKMSMDEAKQTVLKAIGNILFL